MSSRALGETDTAANLWERFVTLWESDDDDDDGDDGDGDGALRLLTRLADMVDEWQGFKAKATPAFPPVPANDAGPPREFTVDEVFARNAEVRPLGEAVFLSVTRIQGEGDFAGFVQDLRKLLEHYGAGREGG